MLPATYNLPTGYRGDSYGPISFYFYNISGSGIPMDGASGALQARMDKNCPVVVEWLTSDGSMTISGNKVSLGIKEGSYMKMAQGDYKYDFQISSGQATKTYVKGVLPIVADVTEI